MRFITVNAERVAAICEECLKEKTALRWWDMEDNDYDNLRAY